MANETRERDPQTHGIIGAAIEVHRELGPGFLEAVYQEALAIEFAHEGVPFQREVALPVSYKGQTLGCGYRADFVCFESVIVEIKALLELTNIELAQALNYLKATGLSRALVLNFGQPRLDFKRVILSSSLRPSASSADQKSRARGHVSAETLTPEQRLSSLTPVYLHGVVSVD